MQIFFRYMLSYLKPYRFKCILLLIGMLAVLAFETIVPLSFKFLIDDVIIPQNKKLLLVILGFLAGGAVITSLIGVGKDYLYASIGSQVITAMRKETFSHLQKLSADFYSRNSTGEITARFTSDIASVENVVIQALPTGMMSFLGLFISTIMLFIIQWQLALLSVAGLALCLAMPYLISRRALAINYGLRDELAKMSGTVQENTVAQSVIRAFGLQKTFIERFGDQMSVLRKKSARAYFYNFMMERTPNTGILVFNIMIICFGSILAFNGKLSAGLLVSFNALFVSLSQSVDGFTWMMPQLIQASAGIKRIEEVFSEQPRVKDAEAAPALPRLSREIAFRDVTFGYMDGITSLDRVNITIPRGKYVFFVGPSGSGKSTVINLIMRFYDPQKGSVSFDGVDLRGVTQESLRSQIGVVFQENFLFNTSVCENIRLGKPRASDMEIEEVAKAAEIHDFIMSLPQGYDTGVGEGGSRLSGGQRQRIAIARSLLHNPEVLLLDEATSALDPVSESAINETLKRVARGRTVISVTHRLSTAASADRIFVLNRGRLVEQGTHGELIQLDGIYRQLWQKQSGFILSDDSGHAEITVERLRMLPILEKLDDEFLEHIRGRFISEYYPQNEVIVREGDPGNKFFIIVRGKVEAVKALENGEETRVGVLQDGDYFGEIALLKNVPRKVSIRTHTPTLMLSLHRTSFQYLVDRAPYIRSILEERISQYQ